jgi:DNA polymerase-3 subunit gamma/tau
MVRFLRNATVAKVAGKDSRILQISGDERERVARVAELFGEEDLARHLQIMLRTHGELGYKHEQRFHLELGLLKMAHAQRLLPIEQLLSEVARGPSSGTQARPGSKPVMLSGGEARRSAADSHSPGRTAQVSPFAADSARKSKLELSVESNADDDPRAVAHSTPARVIMGAVAPAAVAMQVGEMISVAGDAVAANAQADRDVRSEVLRALADAGHLMLASMLESGEWNMEGNEVVVSVAASETVIDMSLGAEAKQLAMATASRVLGRPVKLKVTPGQVAPAAQPSSRAAPNGSSRSRAEQDPVVRRMQEKFGAEVRTIIDYRESK